VAKYGGRILEFPLTTNLQLLDAPGNVLIERISKVKAEAFIVRQTALSVLNKQPLTGRVYRASIFSHK
jgi:hypothetical protein